MEYGAHLPQIAFGNWSATLDWLVQYTKTAADFGFSTLCANDHLVYSRPWIDGPTAMAAVLPHSGDMTLATTVALSVVRGPVQVAKTLGAIDRFSDGRLQIGLGPGSSARDYEAAGIPFEERWKRLDETVHAVRALLDRCGDPFVGDFYSTEGIELEPYPRENGPPEVWIGSWGSDAGLRRVARLADGWLASAFNTTPESFAEALDRLNGMLAGVGKDPESFPNALATMFCFITESRADADRILSNLISPALNRPVEELGEALLVGSAEECAAKLAAYRDAGVQRLYIWPVADEVRQLEMFMERVAPSI